jgi:hypothetical protein
VTTAAAHSLAQDTLVPLAQELNQDKVTPGLLGFVIFAVIALGLWALMKNMGKQMKKINFEEQPPPGERRPPAQRAAGGAAAKGAVSGAAAEGAARPGPEPGTATPGTADAGVKPAGAAATSGATSGAEPAAGGTAKPAKAPRG